MADPQGLLSRIAEGFSSATKEQKPKNAACPHCGRSAENKQHDEEEPVSKKIKRSLGLPDDGAVF